MPVCLRESRQKTLPITLAGTLYWRGRLTWQCPREDLELQMVPFLHVSPLLDVKRMSVYPRYSGNVTKGYQENNEMPSRKKDGVLCVAASGSRHCTSFGMGLLNFLCGSVTIQAVNPFTFFAGAFKGSNRFLVWVGNDDCFNTFSLLYAVISCRYNSIFNGGCRGGWAVAVVACRNPSVFVVRYLVVFCVNAGISYPELKVCLTW